MPASFYDRDRRLRILNNCLMARPIGCIYVRIRGANQLVKGTARMVTYFIGVVAVSIGAGYALYWAGGGKERKKGGLL
jgi:hypothetical protein